MNSTYKLDLYRFVSKSNRTGLKGEKMCQAKGLYIDGGINLMRIKNSQNMIFGIWKWRHVALLIG